MRCSLDLLIDRTRCAVFTGSSECLRAVHRATSSPRSAAAVRGWCRFELVQKGAIWVTVVRGYGWQTVRDCRPEKKTARPFKVWVRVRSLAVTSGGWRRGRVLRRHNAALASEGRWNAGSNAENRYRGRGRAGRGLVQYVHYSTIYVYPLYLCKSAKQQWCSKLFNH